MFIIKKVVIAQTNYLINISPCSTNLQTPKDFLYPLNVPLTFLGPVSRITYAVQVAIYLLYIFYFHIVQLERIEYMLLKKSKKLKNGRKYVFVSNSFFQFSHNTLDMIQHVASTLSNLVSNLILRDNILHPCCWTAPKKMVRAGVVFSSLITKLLSLHKLSANVHHEINNAALWITEQALLIYRVRCILHEAASRNQGKRKKQGAADKGKDKRKRVMLENLALLIIV